MGTRNLTLAILNGKYKMAQYGQWDGYASGVGLDILQFLRTMPANFCEKLNKCKFIDKKTLDSYWQNAGAAPNAEFVNFGVSDKFSELYPQLSRDNAGGKVLQMIADSKSGLELVNSESFGRDGLFCEYCYIVNFDKKELIVHTNLNHPALAVFSFDNLPCDDDFISQVEAAGGVLKDNLAASRQKSLEVYELGAC